MGQLMRDHDWSQSDVGPIETWPQSLRTAISIVLNSAFPMFIWWGKDTLTNFYNDPYAEILGKKHPTALGKSGYESWKEIWDEIGPLADKVFKTGKPIFMKDLPLTMNRNGYEELTYFTFSYSPIRDEGGKIGGMCCVCTETTEEVISREKLQESEERFRIMADASPNLVWSLNPDSSLKYVNSTALDFLGVSLEEFISRSWHPFIHPDDLDATMHAVQGAIQREEIYSQEHRLRHKDGTYRWFLSQGGPSYYSDGKLYGYIGSATDITDRKQAEEALKDSESYYRAMTDNTPIITWITDAEGSCTYLNKQWYDFTGQTEKNALGFGWLDATHPDDAEQSGRVFLAANKKRQPFSLEYRLRHKDGTYRWTIDSGMPKFSDDGTFEGYIGSVVDIHTRKLTEEKLRQAQKDSERQKRLQDTITANTPDLIYLFDLNYTFIYANQALLNSWGKTWDQAIGKGLLENGYEPWHAEKHKAEIDAVIATKEPIRGEVSFTHATLGKRIYDYIFTPVLNDKGDVEAVAGTTRDVTERVQAAKDLRHKQLLEAENLALGKRQQELMKLNKAKDEFIATASHQLRTPATAVKQYIGILLNGLYGPLDPEQAEKLTIAYNSNERQLTIIDDLLKTAQIDSDTYQINRDPHDIVAVMTEAINDMKPTYHSKQQMVAFNAPKEKIPVAIDFSEMKLAFTNLIENASKYSREDSTITIAITPTAKSVNITVADTGVGIDKENQSRIFDKFARIDNELSDTVTGTGLGLYLVRQIVELHDGTISLQSALDSGSKFTIKLPIYDK